MGLTWTTQSQKRPVLPNNEEASCPLTPVASESEAAETLVQREKLLFRDLGSSIVSHHPAYTDWGNRTWG